MPDSNSEKGLSHDRLLSQAEWHNNSFRKIGNVYIFQEPLKKEQVSTNEPPSMFRQDDELSSGYNFLKKYGSKLNLDIFYSQHSEWNDLGGKDFEAKIKEADIYLLENAGWVANEQEGLDQLSRRGRFSADNLDTLDYIRRSNFTRRIATAISSSGARISFFDVNDAPDPIRQGIIQQYELDESIQNSGLITDQEKKRALLLSMAANTVLREWFMVGMFGNQLERFSQEDQNLLDKLSKGKLKVLVTVGAAHRDLTRKFSRYGLRSQEHVNPTDVDFFAQFSADCTRNGRIDVDKVEQAIKKFRI
jgi:hypothetical protein